MKRLLCQSLFCISLLLTSTATGLAQSKSGSEAPDFPPGSTFTDNGTYKLGDLRGKIVVLYFFEPG